MIVTLLADPTKELLAFHRWDRVNFHYFVNFSKRK